MKKTLYLMRHGQTLFNTQHKIQGWCDSPLTDLGIKQARVAAKYFSDNNIKFDFAYASTSERACDTLEIITNYSMEYKRNKGLKEWNFGVFEGKDECLNPPLPYNDFFKTYGGETQDELTQRMNKTILAIMEQDGHDNVLIVSHGAACVNFVKSWDNYNTVKFDKGFKNCSIFKIEFDGKVFDLKEIINHDFSGIVG